jgi:hypothetical protein
MKKFVMICVIVSAAGYGSTARAVTWPFTVETHTVGEPNVWVSPTQVETGQPQYDWNWEITEAKLQLDTLAEPWIDIELSQTSDSGTETGLPFQTVPLLIDQTGIEAEIRFGVAPDGHGVAEVKAVEFRQFAVGGGELADVIGARFSGQFTVTPVPEPSTVALLGLGSLVLIKRRRRIIS